MSLRTKLITGFFLCIIIPLFLLGTVSFFVSQNMIEKKYTELNELTLESVATNIDNIINEVNQLSVATISNPTVQNILSLDITDMSQKERYLHMIEAEDTLKKILYTYPFVYSVTLYDESGLSYQVGQFRTSNITYQKLIHHPIYDKVVARDGLPVWIGPYEYPELVGDTPVLTQIRLVKDVDTLETKGILIMQSKLNSIGGIFNTFTRNNRFLLVGANGLIFYDNRHQLQGDMLSEHIGESIPLPTEYHTYKRSFAGDESLISVRGLTLKDWRVVSIRSWDSLSKEVETIVFWITIITAICLIGALLFNILFVNRTAQKIIDVVRLMKRVEHGDLQVRAREEGSGETRSLTAGFNSLVARIRYLLDEVKQEQERKKKAEMMLREAQIQPHFLFNTLESINVLAAQNQGRKVSRMISQLGQILRVSMEAKEEITVRQELKHLESYLSIQKYRFMNVFDYTIDVPAALKDETILKLTLQPLVENAIQHAFDRYADQKGQITVTAYESKGAMIFFVEDNGCGFSQEALQQLQYSFTNQTQTGTGLGVFNVADRLRIHYGMAYGMMICSSETGTIIRCRIPLGSHDQED